MQLEMRGENDGAEIIHQALKYYAQAYKMYVKGYLPGFLKDEKEKGQHIVKVRVEPFIPRDQCLREILTNLDENVF